jgi:hypothetical protein
MGKNFLCLVLMLCICLYLPAQLNESFNDGNFTVDPAWAGNTADWQVVPNSDVAAGAANSNTLRLNVATGSGATYLSTSIAGSWGFGQSWSYFIGRRAQAYTAANHVLIWLWASEANLLSASINGYRIRIGDDSGGDDIVLQKLTNGVATDIVSGAAALANNLTDAGFLLRVTRNNTGKWQIFTSTLPAVNGTGALATDIPNATNAGILQATATDNTYTVFDNGCTGFANVYGSGAAARAAQEFDQVQVSFQSATMPARLGNFTASAGDAGIKLIWEVLEESGVKDYEVQCSENGAAFIPVASIKAERRELYAFIDNRSRGQNRLYYRLKITDLDGSATYSPVISLLLKRDFNLKIIPGRVRGVFTMNHPSFSIACALQVRSLEGKLLQKLLIPPNTSHTSIDLSVLPAGCYSIALVAPREIFTAMLVK